LRSAEQEALASQQRAADLNAKYLAHKREAEMVSTQADSTTAQLRHMEQAAQQTMERTNVAAVCVPVPNLGTPPTGNLMYMAPPIKEACCDASGKTDWQQSEVFLRRDTAPLQNEFPYILHLRIPKGELGAASSTMGSGVNGSSTLGSIKSDAIRGSGGLPSNILLRLRCGIVEGCTTRLLATRPGVDWNIETSIPIKDVNELVYVFVLDGTGFSNWQSFDWDKAPILGKMALKINNLVDGHVSTDNLLRLDGIGGNLLATLHLESFNIASGSRHGNVGGYSWNKSSSKTGYWTMTRSGRVDDVSSATTTTSGVQTNAVNPMADRVPNAIGGIGSNYL
jgi:hypothetical protein